jgi:hypothetical protein
VTVSINSQPEWIGLTTGPSITFLSEQFIARRHLKLLDETDDNILNISSRVPRRVAIKSFRLGTIEIHDAHVMVPVKQFSTPVEDARYRSGKDAFDNSVAGTLGMAFQSQYDVEFDLADRRVRFYDHENCSSPIQPWPGVILQTGFGPPDKPSTFDYPNGLPIEIPARLNGQPGTVILDSLDTENTLTRESAEHIGITLNTPGVTAVGNAQLDYPFRYYRTMLNSVAIGDETLNNVKATIKDGPYPHDDFLREMYLGVDFFRANRIYIAYAAKRIYFTPYSFTDARK